MGIDQEAHRQPAPAGNVAARFRFMTPCVRRRGARGGHPGTVTPRIARKLMLAML